jgi:hypothetical protein
MRRIFSASGFSHGLCSLPDFEITPFSPSVYSIYCQQLA